MEKIITEENEKKEFLDRLIGKYKDSMGFFIRKYKFIFPLKNQKIFRKN